MKKQLWRCRLGALFVLWAGSIGAFQFKLIDDFSVPIQWDVRTGAQGGSIAFNYSGGTANLFLGSAIVATDVWKEARVQHSPGGKGAAVTASVKTLTGGAYVYLGVDLGADEAYEYWANVFAYGDGVYYEVLRYPQSNLGGTEEMARGALYRGVIKGQTFTMGVGGTDGTLYFYSSNGGMAELKPVFSFAKTENTPNRLWWGIGVDNGASGSVEVSLDNVIEVFD